MIQLEQDEKIVYEIRKHWYDLALPTIITLVLACTPLVVLSIVLGFIPVSAFPFSLVIFFYCIWLLGLWLFLCIEWTDYYLDVWFVTDRRIIDVEQMGVFHRRISSLRFDKIQDVTVEVIGVVAEMLHFGDLSVQTAGENREFVIRGVANPIKAKEMIASAQNLGG